MLLNCIYYNRCSKKGSRLCGTCKNNTVRNKEEDFYEKAEDKPIPEKCPKLSYDGPAEQTSGYKCPVCESFTNPYAMRDNRCSGCGYKLNV
jgi:DNA-directed RNA polymerase subunit RPC12/RpoP